MKYRSTKHYGPELGLSCCFRQWRADSHCNKFHGYALAFTLVFEAETLDDCNWVIDFGGLKTVKEFLVETFDHKTVVADDDPFKTAILALDPELMDIVVMRHVGCEAFAEYVSFFVQVWLQENLYDDRVRLISVECREHGANSGLAFPYQGV
jgi:6-pyruvoyltetrahydropterin/6-carboxytetrahydropterin synthase